MCVQLHEWGYSLFWIDVHLFLWQASIVQRLIRAEILSRHLNEQKCIEFFFFQTKFYLTISHLIETFSSAIAICLDVEAIRLQTALFNVTHTWIDPLIWILPCIRVPHWNFSPQLKIQCIISHWECAPYEILLKYGHLRHWHRQ